MTTPFHHGISARERNSGTIPIRTIATAVIGLIAYADDADPLAYPLNTPVLVTGISRALVGAGYHGTLRRSLEAIQPITNPTIVVIRIANPNNIESVNLQQSNIIGQNVDGQRTGLQCLLAAQTVVGVKPKILIAPELETPDVVQAMIAVAKKLRAYFYATPRDVNGAMLQTKEAVAAYRATLGDREVELVWPEFTSGNVLQEAEPIPTNPSEL